MSALTFAEACEGASGTTEVQDRNGNWVAFDRCGQYQPAFLAKASFRRARPKRSRVEEMAVAYVETWRDTSENTATRISMFAVQAVCDYLRDDFRNDLASEVERKFLEPR